MLEHSQLALNVTFFVRHKNFLHPKLGNLQEVSRESVHIYRKGAGTWGRSKIMGNWKRGTGILNNELYIGNLVWDRQHFIKDPEQQKRQARLNP
ncbi:hypothetical protein, partial [Pacificibacter marinus]|uniref:hypothetical protein n=1 Tax=Pacificibacter marinus TaxID=658057 RepID=UPI001C07ABC2